MTSKKKKSQSLPEQLGCVLYVDGGCRPGYPTQPDSKHGGWGIHGYTYGYGITPPKKLTKKDSPTTSGYRIGEQVDHTEQVVPLQYIDAYGSMTGKDRSDIAELTGFKQALDIIKEGKYQKAHLLLDNQYVIDGATQHFQKWVEAGWRKPNGDPYANQHLWETVMSTYYPLLNNMDIQVSWVNGHSGNLGNDRADYLATKGVYFSRNGYPNQTKITFSPVAKYRSPQPDINRIFAKNRWYFNTLSTEPLMSKCGRYVYHCGAHGPDDTLVGKPMADSVAQLIYTKEKQTLLENVRLRHAELIPNPLNELCMARLDTLLLPRIYDEIEQDGMAVLSLAPRKLRFLGLCTIDEQEVTRVIQPSGLTFKLIDVHNTMEQSLDDFIQDYNTHPQVLPDYITEITDKLYQIDTDKKGNNTYTLTVQPVNKVLRLPVRVCKSTHTETHTASFTIGIDLPNRELMRAVQERRPKVYVKTWPISEFAFRYATIWVIEDDIMMWMGKDSSLQFMYPEEVKRKAKK